METSVSVESADLKTATTLEAPAVETAEFEPGCRRCVFNIHMCLSHLSTMCECICVCRGYVWIMCVYCLRMITYVHVSYQGQDSHPHHDSPPFEGKGSHRHRSAPAKTRRNKKCHERREAKRRAEVHRTHCMCLIHCTSFLYEMSRVSMYTRIRGRFLWPNRDRQFSSQYTSPIPIYTHIYMHSIREYLTRICITINHFCTFTQSCPPVRQNGGGRGGAGGGPNRAPRQPFWPPR